MKPHRPLFPFSALTGQEDMKLALLINAVNPKAGGVLLRGEKGTAKSTAVRALSRLMSEPFINLPLNITEDRFLGGIDIEAALKNGETKVMKGVAAEAHGGFLYIDEINLLNDHIADLLLYTASCGRVNLQREGISASYPAKFIPVGSMNPEEGELRPQLLDKFGLCVNVAASPSVAERVALMENRELFDKNPQAFQAKYEKDEEELKKRIAAARELLKSVRIDEEAKKYIAMKTIEAGVLGHRPDIVIAEASKALAAWNGRKEAAREDMDKAAQFALLHRKNEKQAPEKEREPEKRRDKNDKNTDNKDKPGDKNENSSPESDGEAKSETAPSGGGEIVFDAAAPFKVKPMGSVKDKKIRTGSGRRSKTKTSAKQGRYVRAVYPRGNDDMALDATLRSAAPFQKYRTPPEGMAWAIEPWDIREKEREKRIGNFILFIADASGSMGARGRMAAAKGAVVSLLLDAYQKRDKVAMISFRGNGSQVILPPTSSVELAEKRLREMPTGGKTPLSSALEKGRALTERYLKKDPAARPVIILLTDGKANAALKEGAKPREEAYGIAARWAKDGRIRFIVIDTERKGLVEFALAETLAASFGVTSVAIGDLKADTLINAVKRRINE